MPVHPAPPSEESVGLKLIVSALERAESRASDEREAMRGEFARSLDALALRIDVAVAGVRLDMRGAMRGVILSNVIALLVVAALAGVTSYLRIGSTTFSAQPTVAASDGPDAVALTPPE